MSKLLEGKPIIVIGMDEIGAGVAHRLAREGARLALLDDDPGRAHSIASALTSCGAEVFALPLNYASASASVDAAATRLGGVYALINNVLPTPALASLEQQTTDMFAAAFARVQAAVCAMIAVFKYMREAGEGKIVNIGHRYGENINEGLAAYNAAAWSVVGITRSAALDWGRHQIATNLLLPLADGAELRRAYASRPKIIDLMTSQLPLRRAGDCVEDIGGAVLFLVSDATNFVNGEVVHADGGQHVAGPVLNPIKFCD
jgi:3-oxoacyl-[acyl-carrier protein] reductase